MRRRSFTLGVALVALVPSTVALAQSYPGTSPGTAVPGGNVNPNPAAPTAPLPGSGGLRNPSGDPLGSDPYSPNSPYGAGQSPGGMPMQPGAPANPLSPQTPGSPASPLSPRTPGTPANPTSPTPGTGLGAPGTPGSNLPGSPTH